MTVCVSAGPASSIVRAMTPSLPRPFAVSFQRAISSDIRSARDCVASKPANSFAIPSRSASRIACERINASIRASIATVASRLAVS